MTDSNPCFLSVAEAASLIAAKRISPVELTRAYLARIERLNGTLHAYVRVLHDEALAAARAAEAEILAGRYRGPLHGIPIGLKDIYDTAGIPTEGGSKSCLGRVPAKDATTTRLLREAGAVLLGKLTTWEFAIGAPPSTRRFHRRATPGISTMTLPVHRAGRALPSRPVFVRWRWAATPEARSAGRRHGAGLPA